MDLSGSIFSQGEGVATPHRTKPLSPRNPSIPSSVQNGSAGSVRSPRALPVVNSVLNPLARSFVPSQGPSFCSDITDDSGFLDADDEDPDLDPSSLWSQFLRSDQSAPRPPNCQCHDLPRGSCPEFKSYTVDRIASGFHKFGLCPNMDGSRIPLRFPSFSVQKWKARLGSYFDAAEILNAIEFGWDLSFAEHPQPVDAKRNLSTVNMAPHDIQTYIDQELLFGAIVGPFDENVLPFPLFCSPMGLVEKKSSKVMRTIVDCSQGGIGINAFISAHNHRGQVWNLSLPTRHTIVAAIRRAKARYPGSRLLMWKVDMSRWYRWFSIDPVQAMFFGLRWRGKLFIDTALSFGNRGAALCAQRFIWAITWMFRTQTPPEPGVQNSGSSCRCKGHCLCGDLEAQGYIDDDIGLGPEHLAQHQFDSFLQLAKDLDLRLSTTPGHISPPSPQCVALGILYDLDANTVSLPADKVTSLLSLLSEWSKRTHANERQLASLAGKLLSAAQVIWCGRLFTNNILACKRLATSINRQILLDEAFFEDVRWWQLAIAERNGVSFLELPTVSDFSMDASSDGWHNGQPGIGGYCFATHEYFACTPPDEYQDLHISDLELMAFVIAIHLWGERWAESHIKAFTDNKACLFLVQNGRSRSDLRLRMARFIGMQQVRHQFRLHTEYVRSEDNVLADALSRSGSHEHREIFRKHCESLGGIPRQRVLSPEHFTFNF